MRVRILVSFKDSVLDPQGQTVKNALHTMGYDAVKDVRQGKVFEIDLAGATKANPIIEKFEWDFLKGE